MRIEIGTWLQPQIEDMRDGTISRVDNIVVKNNMLDRVYCTNVCAGFELNKIKIMSKDIQNWVEVIIIRPSK